MLSRKLWLGFITTAVTHRTTRHLRILFPGFSFQLEVGGLLWPCTVYFVPLMILSL